MSGEKIYEGVFAVHKPEGVTSADVIRKLQSHFNPSDVFKPWLETERDRRKRESNNQRRRRRTQRLDVKIGHGGTLDPLATGVLVTGIGKGTKQLNGFLGCTKTYEAVFLFGAETDTYDKLGKVVRRAPYEHITREAVEAALANFRGSIMQRPPVFSALKVNGKKMYEYAREGVMPPVEIQARPVEVSDLRMLEWYPPGEHDFAWPETEAPEEEKKVAVKMLEKEDEVVQSGEAAEKKQDEGASESTKRKTPPVECPKGEDGGAGEPAADTESAAKKQKVSADGEAAAVQPEQGQKQEQVSSDAPAAGAEKGNTEKDSPKPQPPAVKITMTVSSGFYVRSLAHDLGKALGSCGLMSSLIRTRQAHFELGSDKVLEYKDLDAGEEVWGPKVKRFLDEWEKKRASEEGHNSE